MTVSILSTKSWELQQYDALAGLNYNYFRDYDPEIGRYAQSDPIGIWGGLNTYAYGAGNPVSLADPTGENPAAVAAPVVGAVAGGGAAVATGAAGLAGGIGYGAGWVFNRGLNRILEWGTGTSLGGLIADMCISSEDEKRCKAIERGCKLGCTDVYEDDRRKLPGVGTNYQSRWRRCVRECMEAQGCGGY